MSSLVFPHVVEVLDPIINEIVFLFCSQDLVPLILLKALPSQGISESVVEGRRRLGEGLNEVQRKLLFPNLISL